MFPDDPVLAGLREQVKTAQLSEILDRASAAFKSGDWKSAEECADRARQIDPANAVATKMHHQILDARCESALAKSLTACTTNDFVSARLFLAQARDIEPESQHVDEYAAQIRQKEDEHRKEQLAEAPRAIIRRAIEAMGGMDQLGKYKEAYLLKYTGIVPSGQLKDFRFTCEVDFQWPEKLKITTDFEKDGRSAVQVSTIVGDETWTTINGKPAASPVQSMQAQLRRFKSSWVDVLTGNHGSLFLSARENVDGRQAQAMQTTSAAGDRVTLCFDQETGYPVKVAYDARDRHFDYLTDVHTSSADLPAE